MGTFTLVRPLTRRHGIRRCPTAHFIQPCPCHIRNPSRSWILEPCGMLCRSSNIRCIYGPDRALGAGCPSDHLDKSICSTCEGRPGLSRSTPEYNSNPSCSLISASLLISLRSCHLHFMYQHAPSGTPTCNVYGDPADMRWRQDAAGGRGDASGLAGCAAGLADDAAPQGVCAHR